MKFYKSKYTDQKSALKEIDKCFNLLQNKFISLGNDYVNKISGSIDTNDLFYMFRESVLRRLGAALFHYDILANIVSSGNPLSYDPKKSPPDAYYIAIRSSYVFDSIVFHVMSAFDYYGGFIKYLTDGKKKDWKLTWGEMVGKTKHIPNFLEHPLGHQITFLNKEFVKDLISYRGSLIHNKIESPSFSQHSYLVAPETIINVFPPSNFTNIFKKQLAGNDDYNLNEVTLWLVDNVVNGIIELLNATSKYFDDNRKTKPGDELIQIISKPN